ncbi:MAG TPA: alpha/beta hydrolase [Acidimicrobiia bacterium]|nr:alpha/beta hydrolase [Acidimicrobiia bacterium]
MTSRRFAFIAAAVGALVLAGAAAFAACGSESSDRSDRRRAPASTTSTPATTVTTVAPQTIPVPPLPPAGPTTAPPPAISVPRGTAGTTPASTTPPTVTAAPASTTPPTVTNAPVTTGTSPSTSTTKPSTSTTKPGGVTHKTVVYSPTGAPKRQADLVLPRNHADTIVVLVHGDGNRKQMRGWADFYAAHGYPTLAIDFLVAKPNTPSPVYAKPETDVKAAVQYLRGRAAALALDPDRIVVQGFATGAALGSQAEVTPNDAFFDGPAHYASVSDAPAAFIGFYGRYDGHRPDQTKYYGGAPDSSDPQVQARYAEADSITHSAGAAGPVLLFQGDADNPDPIGQAGTFRDALQAVGKDVTLTPVAGAGAYFDQEKSGALTPAGQQAAQQVLEWLEARFPAK